MNDLDKKEFEDIYDKIRTPEDLKSDTLRKMMREDEEIKTSKTGFSFNRKRMLSCVSFAAVFCVAALCFFFLQPKGASYITPMEEGEYYEKVELKDGVICFVKNRVIISISPNAGTVTIGQENQNETENDAPVGEDSSVAQEKQTKSGGVIRFQKISAISLPEIAENKWSYIGEQKIYVTVLDTEEVRYQAVYEKDGNAYELTGTNVTQKEFIDELYGRVKKG